MTVHRSVKHKITEAVLAEIPKSHRVYQDLTIEDIAFRWWFTGRQEGLRLTDEGVTAFQLADIEFYDYEFKAEGKSHHTFMLELNKKIKCPYYLGVNKKDKTKPKFYIRLYDSKIAMVLGLYGTLDEYLESIKVKK